VKKFTPDLFPLALQAYGATSILSVENEDICSSQGVQQGDPAGPLLFCLALKPLADSMESEMSAWYLDDGFVIGSLDKVIADINKVKDFAVTSGLRLNPSKCELLVCGGNTAEQVTCLDRINIALPGIKVASSLDLELLGAPLTDESMERMLDDKVRVLKSMCSRTSLLSTQQALTLLRSSLFAPRITYLLRCSPASRCVKKLQDADRHLHETLSDILNIRLDDRTFQKATLPIRAGGLGIRRASNIAQACYVSSVQSCLDRAASP